MPKAIRIHQNGGPEVMRFEEIEVSAPGRGAVRLRHTAIGINFSDVNVRRGGFYFGRPQQFPLTLGNEAAGVIEALGEGVTGFAVGERVAYAGMRGEFFEDTGAYCEARNVPAQRLLKIPDAISDSQAASMLVKGFTAWLIIKRLYTPKPGDAILIHGVAGGVGLALGQWSKHLGATVIGTVGSQEKAAFVRQHGCDHAILYRETDFAAAVKALVPEGVSAVFDGVGKDTFHASLGCVRRFAMLVNYGNASGHPPPLDLLLLAKNGSLSVARPALSSITADVPLMHQALAELFDLVARGVLTFPVSRAYPLRDAAQAHADIEERKSAGSMLLVV